MASRAATPSNLLQPGRGQCGARRSDDAPQRRASDPAARCNASATARTDRSPGAEVPSDRTLRVLRMADMPRWHRLSHRGRRPLLQRSPSLRSRRGRRAADRADGRNLPQRRAHRRAHAYERQPQTHDGGGTYAVKSSAIRRLDDRAHPRRCASDRTGNGGALRTDPRAAPASRTGLSRLSRHCSAGRSPRHQASGSRSGARHRHRRAHLRFGQIHPRQPSRPASPAKARHGRNADPTRQHPWSALLQLGETNLLKHPTLDQLHALGLHGMAKAFAEIAAGGEADGLGHHEWLGLLLDRETSWRQDKRLVARLRVAKLRQQACVEDVDYRNPRGLDRALFQKLAEGEWINAHDNLALIGPTGVGKSWLASALGHKACRDNHTVLYQRVPRLFEALALARGDGRHPRLLRNLGRADLLILDDLGLEPFDAAARHDLLEILEKRYGRRSTMITSQLPVDRWHEIIGDPTYVDAILNRLVHNAHRIELAGESMRRTREKQTRKA